MIVKQRLIRLEGSNLKIKVALYIRVSTHEQAEKGFSIEAQEEQLRQYCKQNEYIIYKVYTDAGISGKGVTERKELQSLLLDAKNRSFDGVLVWKINRLARNLKDLLEIEQLFDNHSIFLKSMSESIDTSTPHGRLGLQMLGAMGQLERETILENTKLGRNRRNQLGIYCGAKIFGYHVIPKDVWVKKGFDTNLVICEEEAEVVRSIYQWYADGLGLKAIVNRLNKAGKRTKNGCTFSVGTVRRILGNVVYIGKTRYMTEEGEQVVDGNHPPIVDLTLWGTVQTRLGSKKKPNKTSRDFPLAPYIKCPVCGSGMAGTTVKTRRKNGSTKSYSYYECSGYINKGISVCRPHNIPAEKIEQKVLGSIQEFVSQPDIVKDLYERLNPKMEDSSKDNAEIQNLIVELSSKREKLMMAFENNKVDEFEFIKQIKTLDKEKKVLEEKKSIQDQISLEPIITLDEVNDAISQFMSLVKDTSSQKALLATLLSRIEVNEQKELVRIEVNFKNQLIKIGA